MCICAHAVPSPNQICLRRTPQHRLAGPSHTKPSLQPPAQLCSPLSIGGGAETRRGAVCPGVGKPSCKAAFLLSRTSGLAGSTAPPPSLALLLLSLATHRARIRMETIKEARAYQYQGPPHWGLAWWVLISAYQGQENEASKSGSRPQVTLGGVGRDSSAGLFSSLTVHASYPERQVVWGSANIYGQSQ